GFVIQIAFDPRTVYAFFTSIKLATLFRSLMLCGVVWIVADAPCFRSQCTLFGRLVQMHPPRRLGSSSKFALRFSIGLAIDLSFMNSRSSVLRAESRLIFLLTVTRTVAPGLRSRAMKILRCKRGGNDSNPRSNGKDRLFTMSGGFQRLIQRIP